MVKVVKLEIWWEKKVLKIVYINNIYYLYILSLGEKNTFKNRVWPLWPWPLWPHLYYFQKLQCSATDIIRKKSKFSYSTHTQQLTALFLAVFDLFCLTSHSTNEQTAEKCIIFAEEKQHSAIWKQAFIALVCIFFAPSTNESAQGASQEASITTKGGHNRRQAPVIY